MMTNRWGRIVTRVGGTLALSLILVPMARAADTVKIGSGVLEGTVGTDPSVRVFKGVPFAAPPVGDLRWKEPQPVRPGPACATPTRGTRCMQGPMWGPLVTRDKEMREDCLYLNVWTPASSAKAKQPVLVVFYGGGSRPARLRASTDGEWFAQQGIVVVSRTTAWACSGSSPIPS